MPRYGRVVLPGHPHHIVHCGHNRQKVFFSDAEREVYLANLVDWKTRLGCLVHAFYLMTNHVHLVVNPGENPETLGVLMKQIATRQTKLRNRTARRSGTLWKGRYRSSPIERDAYLLACCRYIDLNPVRARMVAGPGEYPWSSYRSRARVGDEAGLMHWLDPDPCYLALGPTSDLRATAYRSFVAAAPAKGEWECIRSAVRRGQLTGTMSSEIFTVSMILLMY